PAAAGPGRGVGAELLRLAPDAGTTAEPPGAVQHLRRAVVRGDLPAAVRLPDRVRHPPDIPARAAGADTPAARAAQPRPAAALRLVRCPAAARAGGRRSRGDPGPQALPAPRAG